MRNDGGPKLPPFPLSYRACGLLLHVTSLPSPYGICDVGPAASACIDQLSDAVQTWWQALPLGPTLVNTKCRPRIIFVIVILCCWIPPRTRSQGFTEASSGTRSLGPLPFQLVLPREHLLGDWYRKRTWLEDHGITPTLTFVTDSLSNPTGGREQGFTTANNVGLDLNFDLEKLGVVQGGSVLLSVSYRFGGSLDMYTKTHSTVYDARDDTKHPN